MTRRVDVRLPEQPIAAGLTLTNNPLAAAAQNSSNPAAPGVIPAAALSIAIVSFVLNIPGNALSRQVERSADGHALDLDRDPAAFIAVERKLALQNLGDPNPPDWLQLVFGTHPKTVDRIGYALSWARSH